MRYDRAPIVLPEAPMSRIYTFPESYKLFKQNVVELVVLRRVEPPDRGIGHRYDYRRMLATSNFGIVKQARVLFRWEPPKGTGVRKTIQWQQERNLILVWDMMLRHWRMVNLDWWIVIGITPGYRFRERNAFIKFYNEKYRQYHTMQRKRFGDKVR